MNLVCLKQKLQFKNRINLACNEFSKELEIQTALWKIVNKQQTLKDKLSSFKPSYRK